MHFNLHCNLDLKASLTVYNEVASLKSSFQVMQHIYRGKALFMLNILIRLNKAKAEREERGHYVQ